MNRDGLLRGQVFRCKLVGMRKIVYSVASSLDGFIAGPNGEYDWIVSDPSFDFVAHYERFDTLLLGRKTFEVALTRIDMLENMGKKLVVVSQTVDAKRYRGVTVIARNLENEIVALKASPRAKPGKDIWLMGGGALFRSLLDLGLVDSIEVAIMPVILGSGVPLLPAGAERRLELMSCSTTPIGVVHATYTIGAKTAASPRAQKSKSRQKT